MKSEFYENALKKQGAKFTYVERLSLDDIDGARSLRNQARLFSPIDEELVDAYALAYKAGDQFPPLVAWKPGKRHVLVDGNQRFTALRKLDRKTHDAYVIDTDDPMVAERITWQFNNMVNGKRLSPEECLAHAVSWVRKYGRPAKEAAAEWGIAAWKVAQKVRIAEMQSKLMSANVRTNALADDTMDKFSPLLTVGDDVLVEALKTAGDSAMTQREADLLVKHVQAAAKSEDKLAAVKEFAASNDHQRRVAETKGGKLRSRTNPRAKFMVSLNTMSRLTSDYQKSALLPPAGERFEEARDLALAVAKSLVSLFGLQRRIAQ